MTIGRVIIINRIGRRIKDVSKWCHIWSPIKSLYLLFILILAYWVVSVHYGIEFNSEFWVQVILTFGLVLVAAMSVRETRNIRELTAKQLEEMREDKQNTFKPVLLVKCHPIRVQSDTRLTMTLENIGPGPALDIGFAIIEGLPQQLEIAWEIGETSGITILGIIEPLESAPAGKENSISIPKSIPFTFAVEREFLIVAECDDIYGNTIGSYRRFRLLKSEQGEWLPEPTRTVTGRKINHRVSSYP